MPLTPAQQRELELWFAQALDASSDRRREYPKADELFRQCLARDGGNVLIVTAYLENLARWQTRTPKRTWRGWWKRRALAAGTSQPPAARYAAAIEAASLEADQSTLKTLAAACRDLDWPLAEEAYLLEILRREPLTASAHARLAELRFAQADFTTASRHAASAGQDSLSADLIAALKATTEPSPAPAERSEASQPDALARAEVQQNSTSPHPPAPDPALQQVQSLLAAHCFTAAETLLARAQSASGHSLALREAREEVQLAQLRHQFAALEELDRRGNALAAQARKNLHEKLTRMELDIAGARADRYPDDWPARLRLAQHLIRVGNDSEALRRLTDPPSPPPGEHTAAALLLRAESHQRLRHFEKALAAYQELLATPSLASLPEETQSRAQRQHARLAQAMNKP